MPASQAVFDAAAERAARKMRAEIRTNGNGKKSMLLKAIVNQHNQKEHPITNETAIVIVTLTFRMLEHVWRSCGPEEVWTALRSHDRNDAPPDPKDFVV